jgi:hypothetical protein
MNPTSVTFAGNPTLHGAKPPESLSFIKDYLSRFISCSQSRALQLPYPIAHGHGSLSVAVWFLAAALLHSASFR